MNVYFRGGGIEEYKRKSDWAEKSIQDAPKTFDIYPFKFKLHPVKSLDGGLIYDCVNENIEYCEDCHGKGHHDCPECEGTGEIDCEECDGAGWAEKAEDKKSKEKKEQIKKAQEEALKKQIPMEL